jgi:IclR family mhp operon transcriptional activator
MAIDDRLLKVLRAFNECGPASVVEVSDTTGISRPAVYRIVRSLCETGYLRRKSMGALYELTELVLTLSAGYREQSWISVSGIKAIEWLQERVRWPTTLTTHERGNMIVRETTRFRSPLVFDLATIGMSIPMFRTAMGLAYYAHCDDNLRQIIRNLASADDLRSVPTDAQISVIRRRGYAMRIGGVQPKTSSIALPLLARTGPIGAICVTYAKNALTTDQAVGDLLPDLRTAALEIMKAYEQTAT